MALVGAVVGLAPHTAGAATQSVRAAGDAYFGCMTRAVCNYDGRVSDVISIAEVVAPQCRLEWVEAIVARAGPGTRGHAYGMTEKQVQHAAKIVLAYRRGQINCEGN